LKNTNKIKFEIMKNIIGKLITISLLALMPVINTFSQPYPGSNANAIGDNTPINCTNVPVGNGFWILLALAFSYGVYKIWQMRKAEKTA
jgi:hypothetical protein